MFGVGSEISAQVVESEAWDYLDAPIERVTGAGTSSLLTLPFCDEVLLLNGLCPPCSIATDLPTPYAANLEAFAFPDNDVISKVVKRALYRS
jgi:pyruvate dehydrogenase E1 component beta subunit